MGFIAQTFGNTFRTSNGHSDTQQSYSSTRKFHSKPVPKDYHYTRVVSAAPQLHLSEGGAHKKRRHVGPDNSVAATSSVLERPSYCSSVGSDEPLILPASKGKGKSTSGAMQDSNRNQSAYANGLSSPSHPRLQARPPTTNWLDTRERSELVRRSRKLGSILGETPRLLDVEEDDHSATEVLDKLEDRQIGRAKSRVVASERPTFRRSLTLDTVSVGPNLSPSRSSPASRHSFLLNDENSSGTPRSPHHRSGPGPRFGRTRSTARHAPLLRLSTTSVSENTPSYLGRRHSLDVSARKGVSLNAVDMNVGFESGSDISAPKAPSFDTSSLGSSTMPTFARPQSPCSLLDNASLSSRVSLNDSMANVSLGVPGQYATELSLPPSPTTPLTPILTQAEDARRKMRKLARHLGESVPADLVLGTAGARRAAHDHLTEDAAPQFLQVPASGRSLAKSKANSGASVPFSLGKPPSGHRKTQSVWKGTNGERGAAAPSRRIVRRASSAGQLRIETPTSSQMTVEEKARNVRRAMKMLQMFGAPPPHELYTNIKSHSLDLPPDAALPGLPRPAGQRASVNSLRDLAYILDHDNRNSLLVLIGDTLPNTDGSVSLPLFVDTSESTSSQSKGEEEPFQARRARANKLAKFFGVSYRDLFDAVCAEDGELADGQVASSSHQTLRAIPEVKNGSEVLTNDGSKWVEPKSVDEVLDRLRAMKAPR